MYLTLASTLSKNAVMENRSPHLKGIFSENGISVLVPNILSKRKLEATLASYIFFPEATLICENS